MASQTVKDEASLKLPKTFNEVSNLSKPKLQQICNILSIDFLKSIGKKAQVNRKIVLQYLLIQYLMASAYIILING